MCQAVTISVRDLPSRYLSHDAIKARLTGRGGEEEVQFFYHRKPFPALLPIVLDEQFRIVRWGNRQRTSKVLPTTGWISKEDLDQGLWQNLPSQEVVIVGNAALDRGVWFPLLQGIRGLYVEDEKKVPTVFMLMDKPTDYYQIMTKSRSMPMIIGEVI